MKRYVIVGLLAMFVMLTISDFADARLFGRRAARLSCCTPCCTTTCDPCCTTSCDPCTTSCDPCSVSSCSPCSTSCDPCSTSCGPCSGGACDLGGGEEVDDIEEEHVEDPGHAEH